MDTTTAKICLETGLNLRQLTTTGSILHLSQDYDESDYMEPPKDETVFVEMVGEPIKSFVEFEKTLRAIDEDGFVQKKVLENGGGFPIHEGCTVSISFSGYWEDTDAPFEIVPSTKPMVVDLNDCGLLPGLKMAVMTMLVGETSVFLLSYRVMYGEMGILPRIKAKSDCVFYVKLIKSILTPKEGPINYSEPNMFPRVYNEARSLYTSACTLYKAMNYNLAIQLFNKAVSMLHRCHLADDKEEEMYNKLLKKLYLNLAICYNKIKRPLKACMSCNELHRLDNLYNNGKALLQNAKALRMIGIYEDAEKKLRRAMKLAPDRKEIEEELMLLMKTRNACNQSVLTIYKNNGSKRSGIDDEFKNEVDNLIANFKENIDICKLTLPEHLDSEELEYIKDKCAKENLYINTIPNNVLLEEEKMFVEAERNFVMEKEIDFMEDVDY